MTSGKLHGDLQVLEGFMELFHIRTDDDGQTHTAIALSNDSGADLLRKLEKIEGKRVLLAIGVIDQEAPDTQPSEVAGEILRTAEPE